ncbi:MAG: hypothetical protein J5J00_04575 [Deltaproteobacteria bacterium]|nr:hypothetical protein [Deltaproteobacteria bacterium]
MRRITILLLMLAVLCALFFVSMPGRRQTAKPVAGSAASQEGAAQSAKEGALNVRSAKVRESEPGFTLDELLNLPTQGAGEQASDEIERGGGRAQSQTVRARALESGGQSGYSSSSGDSSGAGYSSSPAIEALREIEESASASRGTFLGGVRVSGSPTLAQEVIEDEPEVFPTATPTAELVRVGGQARGYTMLYLMHPKARATVEKQIEILLKAQVQDVYLGVLTDGTFSKDFNYLSDVIRRLSRANRSVTLVVYLTNGATMRAFDSNISTEGFNSIDPTEFRSLIRFDAGIRDRFVRLIRPVIPALALNRRLNERSRNHVIVMLEDNLDDESYLAMRRLAESVIGNRASFIRNPCPGCWEGNTLNPFGDGLELHRPEEIDSLNTRDGFSLDGYGYSLASGSEADGAPLSYEETRQLMIRAASRGLRYFGLWRFERQGLRLGQPVIPPDEREFEVPSDADVALEIELLRSGLAPVEN